MTEQSKPAEPFTEQYRTDRYIDALKLIGAGNTSGLFALGFAIFNAGQRPALILTILKVSLAFYTIGLLLFVLAFILLTRNFMILDASIAPLLRRLPSDGTDKWKAAVTGLSLFSATAWLLGSFVAIGALLFF
jgi:uncharacterized membrane protein YvlD (DUF360 family)